MINCVILFQGNIVEKLVSGEYTKLEAAQFRAVVAIIALIAQGNKHSFYYDRILAMQSGMVALMTDMVEKHVY